MKKMLKILRMIIRNILGMIVVLLIILFSYILGFNKALRYLNTLCLIDTTGAGHFTQDSRFINTCPNEMKMEWNQQSLDK